MALSRDTTFWHIFPCFLDASRTPRSPVFDWLMTRASSRLQRASASSPSSSCTPQKNPHSPEKPQPHVRTNQNRKQTPKRQKPPPNKTPSCATPKQTPETPRKPNPETPGNHTIIYLQKHPGNPLLPLTPTILLAEKERTKQPDYPCLRFRLKSRSLPHK